MPHNQSMGCRSLASEIDHIRDPTGFFELANDSDCFGGYRFLCLVGRGPDVMSSVESFLFANLIGELAFARRWFTGINIQASPNTPGLHRFNECRLVNDFATRCVDEVRPRAHGIKEILADHIPRVVSQGEMDT